MKEKIVIDIGQIMDEIFEATKNFGEAFQENFKRGNHGYGDDVDYYPSYSYPPVNIYLREDKSLIFEFALAGFSEKNIDLTFRGDYMIFSAHNPDMTPEDNVRYFKRRLKFKEIKDQKYFVPEDKFDQENVKAVFKNGILRITVPPKDIIETKEGIKVEIIKEDE